MTGASYQEFCDTDMKLICRMLDIRDLMDDVKRLAAEEEAKKNGKPEQQ